MDYIRHVKYSSSHRQFFQVFTIAPDSISWNTGSQGGMGMCCHY